jgi:hypothetical protein
MKKRLLDPAFRYTPSYSTDLRKTFERIRREQQADEGRGPSNHPVIVLRPGKAGSK